MLVCRHPTLGLQVGSVSWGFFFILMKVSFVPRALQLFDISLVAEKNPLFVTIVIINSDKALFNQTNKGIWFNYWTPNFVLIYCCKIYPYYSYILFTWKSKCSEGCCFCMIYSINLDPTVMLMWNGNIKEKSFVYFFQKNLFLEISKCFRVKVLKILIVWTLKNSQSSVTLENECK